MSEEIRTQLLEDLASAIDEQELNLIEKKLELLDKVES